MAQKYLLEYETCGGFPESLLIGDEGTRVRYLQDLAETVLFRDVIRRYNLPNPDACWRLMQMLLGQMSCPMSYAKLKKRLDGERQRMSADMIATVTGYLENAYLLFTVEIFSLNIAVRKTNPKKVYCVDHAIAMAVSGSLTQDSGKILENIVFMHLRRQTDRIFYGRTPEDYEIDFVVLERGRQLGDCPPTLYQVCYDMSESETRERELRALESGMRAYGAHSAFIITQDMEEQHRTKHGAIQILPVWKFLLMNSQFSITGCN